MYAAEDAGVANGLLQPGKKHGLERTRIIILCHSYLWFKLIFFALTLQVGKQFTCIIMSGP